MRRHTLVEALDQDALELTCLECGKPLEILHHEGKWMLGHFDKSCGYIFQHPDILQFINTYKQMKDMKEEKEQPMEPETNMNFVCLYCGNELRDSNGIVLEKFGTQVKHVHCAGCEWRGYRKLTPSEKE